MNLKNASKALRAGWILPMLMLLGTPQASARQTRVEISLPSFNYDVIYLTDYLDFTTQKIKTTIPDFAGEIHTIPRNAQPAPTVYLKADAFITLRGQSRLRLATVRTKDFVLNDQISLSSGDLAREATGTIQLRIGTTGYDEGPGKQALQDAISDLGQSTAPVGTYELELIAYQGPYNSDSDPILGRVSRSILVRGSNTNEFTVTLIDPQPGATLPSTLPTFTWSSTNPVNTIYVFEKLPIYHSPEEAIGGIPHLKIEVTSGASTFSYPPNAQRRLEQNKSYYWFVETSVTTNRGTQKRRSEIRLFRVRLEDPVSRTVDRLLTNLGGSVSGTYATLQSLGWTPSRVTLNGRALTLDELNALINQLTEQNIKDCHVE